jgi:hypothetical protein
MRIPSSTPNNLAVAIHKELHHHKLSMPTLESLYILCEVAFYSSLKTEESQPIVFQLVYLDPKNPDPDSPENEQSDRWTYIPLHNHIPLTISNLVKIAKSSDPRSSSIAVYHKKQGSLYIHGLVDQGNSYNEFINYESSSGFDRPGIFQLAAVNIGHLVASIEMSKIAELRVNAIFQRDSDVLNKGPVFQRLLPGINHHSKLVRNAIKKLPNQNNRNPISDLSSDWITVLSRLLLRIRGLRHGGAILIIPDKSYDGLQIKYRINYDRLPKAIFKNAMHEFINYATSDIISKEYIDKKAEDIPIDLYFDELISQGELENIQKELNDTIWFVSLLSRVDGLVLMDTNLRVLGFCTEILFENEPKRIYASRTAFAKNGSLRELDYDHFGTRHRSMMRYCAVKPNSLGFVISQDGDVRAMTMVRRKLVIWENIKLQLPDFVSHKREISEEYGQQLQLF